jgi:hypothetical protein
VTEEEPTPAVLRVVRGEPDPAELAALVAVLAARAGAATAAPVTSASAWNDHGRALRRGAVHGANAWRASSWPR